MDNVEGPRLYAVSGDNANHLHAVKVADLKTQPRVETASKFNANPSPKASLSSSILESDSWNQREPSSGVNIELGVGTNTHSDVDEDDADHKKCLWLQELWSNCILPGFFGIESRRVVRKLKHKHPISKQLVSNVETYNSIISDFIRDGLLPEIQALATQLYFPAGQLEAQGLSVISAEIWAATYLLLGIHKKMREADFHNIRSAYSSLAWDSGQAYRTTLQLHHAFQDFKRKTMPIWGKIETLLGIQSDDSPARVLQPLNSNVNNKRLNTKTDKGNPSLLPARLRVCDELLMQNNLGLQILPELKSAPKSSEQVREREFTELEYGEQMEIVKGLLVHPAITIQNSSSVLQEIEAKLRSAISQERHTGYSAGKLQEINNISCTRALNILAETVELVLMEVKLTVSLRFDITEAIRTTAREIHAFIDYTQWIIDKFSEFHSMLRLCYNFASLCFDLDLPSFEKVLAQEKASVDVRRFGNDDHFHEDNMLEYKVASLTKLMMEATASVQKTGCIDDDFDWADFYKTEYHWVLQRLPLRSGSYFLQFKSQPEAKLIIRQRIGTTSPLISPEESLTNMPRRIRTVYRKDQLGTLECSPDQSVQLA